MNHPLSYTFFFSRLNVMLRWMTSSNIELNGRNRSVGIIIVTSIEQTIKSVMCIGKTLSTTSMSFENRDKMRPKGVVSKKSIGARLIPEVIIFWLHQKQIFLFQISHLPASVIWCRKTAACKQPILTISLPKKDASAETFKIDTNIQNPRNSPIFSFFDEQCFLYIEVLSVWNFSKFFRLEITSKLIGSMEIFILPSFLEPTTYFWIVTFLEE